jgi:peptide/nickel transport system substrate-binding protein
MKAFGICLGLLLAWCVTANAEENPQRGGTLVFSVYTGEPVSFDCHASIGSSELYRLAPHYSMLVKIDQHNYPNIAPDAADSWTTSPDGLTYTFKLHPGIKFHDGSPLTSGDVKATYERLRNPPTGVVSMRRQQFVDIASIETPDDLTVVFKLSKPNASMMIVFANPFNCLYSAKLLASDPDYPARKVMGSGPFKFVEYIPGSEWRGERFEGYFREGKPYLDGFKVLSVTGPALLNALVGGRIMTDFRGVAPTDRDRIVAQAGDKYNMLESQIPGLLLVTLNTTRKPLDDARVRRALSLAIDRWQGEKSIGGLSLFGRAGGFQRLNSPYARTREELEKMPGFSPDIAASRAEAKRLLAEAGVHDLKLTFTSRPHYQNYNIFLIDQWRQIGVDVTLRPLEQAPFATAKNSHNFDMIIDLIPDYVDDPTIQLVQFLSYKNNPTNGSQLNDPVFDALFEKQAGTLDVTERKKLVRDLEQHLLTEVPSMPFFWGTRIVPLAKEVRGFTICPAGLVGQDLVDIWLSKS